MEKTLHILLIEDDMDTCNRISNYIASKDNMDLAGVTNNSYVGIQYVQNTLPDAVILDLELHHGGGNGLFFLSDLNKLGLEKKPYILVTTYNSSKITLESARRLGADFIIGKYEDSYSPESAVDFLEQLLPMIEMTESTSNTSYMKDNQKDLEQGLIRRIHRELELIGINPKVVGYKYLTDAIMITIDGPTTNISQILGNKYKKSNSSVERAMQNAINRAWNSNDTETLLNCYTAHINPDRGMPTIKEFIYFYAEKITDGC